MLLKILNYNILHGFHQTEPPYQFETERLKNAQAVIAAENADLVILTEACYGSQNPFGFTLDYKTLFGYPYGAVAKWGNYEWGNCLLSKFPIEETVVIPLLHRTALRTKLTLEGKPVTIDVVHLPPEISDSEKIKTLEPLLRNRSSLYVLAGDLNALSPQDSYDKTSLVRKRHTERLLTVL